LTIVRRTSKEIELNAKSNQKSDGWTENVGHNDPISMSMCSTHQDVSTYED